VSRLIVRPLEGVVLTASGEPARGVRLRNGNLERVPEVEPWQQNYLADLAASASGRSKLSAQTVLALHYAKQEQRDRARAARRRKLGAAEQWDELATELAGEKAPKVIVLEDPASAVTAAAFCSDPRAWALDVIEHAVSPAEMARAARVAKAREDRKRRAEELRALRASAAELDELQAEEDRVEADLQQREHADRADEEAASGLGVFARRLLGHLGTLADREVAQAQPAQIELTIQPELRVEPPAVHVAPPDIHVAAPDVRVTVKQEPRPGAIRAIKSEDGSTLFEVLDPSDDSVQPAGEGGRRGAEDATGGR
jgi:hypothetical protein